jgi:uncharacterized protein YbjT (DUF2867 family)
MNLTIVAATGGIGRQLVSQALDAGHTVTAVVRNPAAVTVPAVTVDLASPDPTRAIVAAMKETGARRVVVVSAAPIGTVPSPDRPHPPRHDPGEGFVMRNVLTPIVKRVLRAHYADLARMEDVMRNSGLDWTVVRPPQLTDRPLSASYRTAYGRNLRGGRTISRADVAHYMLEALRQPESIGREVGIAY